VDASGAERVVSEPDEAQGRPRLDSRSSASMSPAPFGLAAARLFLRREFFGRKS